MNGIGNCERRSGVFSGVLFFVDVFFTSKRVCIFLNLGITHYLKIRGRAIA